MLTLIIIGLVAAMAVHRYGEAQARYRADAAAQRVVANLENAQTQAASSSGDITVWFRVYLDIFEITANASADNAELIYQTHLSEDPYFCDITEADFGGNHFVVFDGFGKPNTGGTATLEVGGLTRTITLDPDTGKATLQ